MPDRSRDAFIVRLPGGVAPGGAAWAAETDQGVGVGHTGGVRIDVEMTRTDVSARARRYFALTRPPLVDREYDRRSDVMV